MRWGVVVVALLIAAPAVADDQPPLETAVARAKQANKPLVIELYADWCKPCIEFEKRVLSRADVKQALEGVVFIRYDIDREPGESIATTLNIEGVPAFVTFDAEGHVVEIQRGLSARPRERFLELIGIALRGKTQLQELQLHVEYDPTNVSARMRLAKQLRAMGRNSEAIAHLSWVADNSGSPDIAAKAAAERDELKLAEARLDIVVADAERFVETYPSSPLASERLVALSLSGRVSRDRVKVLAMAHLDSVVDATWPQAIRAALLVNGALLAQASIDARLAKQHDDRVALLMRAELLVFTGKVADAERAIEAACRAPGQELWCFSLRQSLDVPWQIAAAIGHLREQAERYVQGSAESQHDHSLYALAAVAPRFGDAVADALANAQSRCEHLADRDAVTLVDIRFASWGRPSRVRVAPMGSSDVEGCVTSVLRATHFPLREHAVDHVNSAITFKAARGAERPVHHDRLFGVAPYLAARFGDLETYSFRGEALLEVAGRRRSAWLIGATAELGGSDRGEPAYAAQVMVGRELALGPRIGFAVLAGVGVSDLSTDSPVALELPVVAQLRHDLGWLRLHASATVASRFPARMDASSWLSDTAFGWAASVRIGHERRVYFGGQREARDGLGNAYMFAFGTTIGELY